MWLMNSIGMLCTCNCMYLCCVALHFTLQHSIIIIYIILSLLQMAKQFAQARHTVCTNCKKVSLMCQREWRKAAAKSQKASKDAPTRAKRLLKEVTTLRIVSVSVCASVCASVCVCMCMCVCLCLCDLYVCVCIRVYIRMCVCVCVCACVCVVYVYMCTCMCMCYVLCMSVCVSRKTCIITV